MTITIVKNMGASVRQRLLNHGKATSRPFAEVLQYYAMERFLYRLSVSPHAKKFLLKGALLLTAWKAPSCARRWTLTSWGELLTTWIPSSNSCGRWLYLRLPMMEWSLKDHPSPTVPLGKMPTTREPEPLLLEGWMRPVSICKLISGLVML